MEKAFCSTIEQQVNGFDLYMLDDVQSLTFVCPTCYQKLVPCAFIKGQYQVKPYFKL